MTARSHGRFLAAATATVLLVLLAAIWLAGPAQAGPGRGTQRSTSSCTNLCFNLFSEKFSPDMVQASVGGRASAGSGIGLEQASNTTTSEDFVARDVGLVTTMCDDWPAPGSLSPNSYACLYDAAPLDVYAVFEANYAPGGTPTDLCAGLESAAKPGEQVTLQTCGSAATDWIPGTSNFAVYFLGGPLAPWINASDTSSSQPEVLTATDNESHGLVVDPEGRHDSQEWGIIPGVMF